MSGRRLDQYSGLLSPSEVAEGMTVASSNSRRLADDAQRLFESGSYPSAAALAILSIEESGKISILRGLSLIDDPSEAKKRWRDYRSHTKKNVMAPLMDLVSHGARTLEDFRPLFEEDAEHPRLVDNLKQIAFYTDCLGETHWSDPTEVIDPVLAEGLVRTADALCKDRQFSEEEVRLWIKHLKPVQNMPLDWQKRALVNWHRETVELGLKEDTSLDVEAFLSGDAPFGGGGNH